MNDLGKGLATIGISISATYFMSSEYACVTIISSMAIIWIGDTIVKKVSEFFTYM